MAAIVKPHMSHHDDTLMGLQELDSPLSIFESSNPTPESSTTGAPFTLISDEITVSMENGAVTMDTPEEMTTQRPLHEYNLGVRNLAATAVPERHPKADRSSKKTIYSKIPPKADSILDSLASSTMTDLDDASSALSSLSSRATPPTDVDSSRETTKSTARAEQGRRHTYNVRPKVSIPTDIAPAEYARQCVAAAESSRLNPYSLHAEEYTHLRSHITHQQVTTYLNIRNGILRLWTRNPLISVMRDEAVGCAKDMRWFDVASFCHEWLVRRGYINYGCLESVRISKTTTKNVQLSTKNQKTIVIIGAGMSGLGCARQLEGLIVQFEDRFHDKGWQTPRVIVLEGRDRVGGRVYSRAFKSKPRYPALSYGSRYTAEMGGMIITGFDRGNPLNIIVRSQLALPYHALRSATTIYDATGRPVDENRDHHAEELFNYILDRVSEYKFSLPVASTSGGDRTLIDSGREPHGEGSSTIKEIEEKRSPTTPRRAKSSHTPEVQMIPVSSDRLTGRAHLEPGIQAVHTAAFKAKEIGWLLRPGVGIERDLDLETAVSSKYATLGSVFDAAIKQYELIVDFTPLDLRLINWHVANLEYSNATTCSSLSLGGWDLDAGNEWEGKHTMVAGGYQQVPRGLLNCPRPLDVRKKSAVKRIVYSPDRLDVPSMVECQDGEIIEADYIVSSVPLGVFKHKDILFEPELPDWKSGAVSRLGFGVLNKVVLVFKEAFWDQSRDIFGTLRNPANRFSLDQRDYLFQRGRFFQWFNCTQTSGLPTLLALMAGDAAFQTEKTSNDDLVFEATKVLKTIFGPRVPSPIEVFVTRWGQDKFAHGSYSYTSPTFQPKDYEVMAKSIGNLFFAGEHTCGTHPATVHGAYISGLRAASEVLEAMLGAINIPEPLVRPKYSMAKRKADAIHGPLNQKEAHIEAYGLELWNTIYAKLGEKPLKPTNNYANPYRLYTKDKWEEAKEQCEEGRRPGKGKPIPNEVKKMVTKMWREAPESEKLPYIEEANDQKTAYAAALADFDTRVTAWDRDSLALRAEYEREHPRLTEERLATDNRGRKATRVSGYAEDSGSDIDI